MTAARPRCEPGSGACWPPVLVLVPGPRPGPRSSSWSPVLVLVPRVSRDAPGDAEPVLARGAARMTTVAGQCGWRPEEADDPGAGWVG
jgi:hypothetical protein